MSEILTKVVVDCTSGEEQIVPLTPEEIADFEESRIKAEAERLSAQQAAADRASAIESGIAKLVALGLTEEEANALIN